MKAVSILLFVILATAGYIYYSQVDFETNLTDERENLLKTLPNISVQELNSETDKKIYDFLINKNKKLVVVHFWGTWCAPCLTEFPEMMRLIDKFKDRKDVIFFLIAANDQKMDVKKFFKTYESFAQNSHVLLENNNHHRTQFGVTKVPETFVFTGDLRLIKRYTGPQDWDSKYYIDYLRSLLTN